RKLESAIPILSSGKTMTPRYKSRLRQDSALGGSRVAISSRACRRLWGLMIYLSLAAGRLVTQLSQLLCIVVLFLDWSSGLHAQDLQAEKIHGWDFQRDDDRNLDQEPDGWRRRRDRQHPAYVSSRIVSRDEQRARAANAEQ